MAINRGQHRKCEQTECCLSTELEKCYNNKERAVHKSTVRRRAFHRVWQTNPPPHTHTDIRTHTKDGKKYF